MKAPEPQVRAVLVALCQDRDTRARALGFFEGLLLAIDKRANTLKRKADDELCICVQCDEAFYKNDNTDNTACSYHWGEKCQYGSEAITNHESHIGSLEIDYQAPIWADDDEARYGNVDTKENRQEYPEGFVWDCCNVPGDEPGCKLGKHEANPMKSRREAGSEPSDLDADAFDDDDDDDDDEDDDDEDED